MKSFFKKFDDWRASHEPLIEVRVSRAALLYNLSLFKERVGAWRMAPVLKSNAYGHGLLPVAKILEGHSDIAFLVVDSYYEARVLRTEGIRAPLLIIGHTATEAILESPFKNVSFSVATLSQLSDIAKRRRKTPPLHIKIDTGMHRQGMMPYEIPEALKIISKNPMVRIDGICSHLSDADGEDPVFTREQIKLWNEIVKVAREKIPNAHWYHLSATKGVRYVDEIDANVLRLGIGLYGIDPVREEKNLKPALSLHTSVTALRTISSGESVGYNRTFTATRETVIATIPVGYYEGIDRRLSDEGVVRIKDHECPIIGRVSMNMATIDVTDVPNVQEGDPVLVISNDPEARNSASKVAEACGTIPYEILVHIPAHLRRTIAD